jgi:ClpP class serine protease
LISYTDFIPAFEKKGAKHHIIASDLSPDKIKQYQEIREGNYENVKKDKLNPIALQFQNWMTSNRPAAKAEHLTGKVYFAKDVMNVFVDSIGTFDQAIARAAVLGTASKSNVSSVKPNMNSTMKNYPKLNALLGISELASDEGFSSLSDQQLETIEANLGITAELVDDGTHATELQQRDERIAKLEKELTELRNEPAAASAAVVISNDPGADSKGATTVKEGDSTIDAIAKIKLEFGIR